MADNADNLDKPIIETVSETPISGVTSGQIGFSDGSGSTPVKGEPKKQSSAQRAVLIASTNKLSSDQSLTETLFHGPKEQNVRVNVGKDSTAQGELLPAPWNADGQVSEAYLMKGCKFEEHISNPDGKTETIKTLKDSSKLGTYVQNLTESDQELKRLHASHVLHESKTVTFDSILQKMGPEETVVAKVMCKALINAPATGYDIVSDLVVVMTQMKTNAAQEYRRRVYFFHVAEHEQMSGSRINQATNSMFQTTGCCLSSSSSSSSSNMTKESMAFSLQTSIYMDYLNVDQIVQMFYQQVEGTKVDKVFEVGHGGVSPEFKAESFDCCKWLLSCLFCRCFECPGCPSCCSCTKFSLSTEGQDSKYELQARTAKALQEVIFTEAKLLTSDAGNKGARSAITDVKMSNFNAIHFRWFDPLTQQVKETIALVSPTDNAVNVRSFVGLAARAPNDMFASAAQQPAANALGSASSALGASKPSLGFTPGKSAVDSFRSKAIYVLGAVPASNVAARSVASLGQGLLAGFGGGGKKDDAQGAVDGGFDAD